MCDDAPKATSVSWNILSPACGHKAKAPQSAIFCVFSSRRTSAVIFFESCTSIISSPAVGMECSRGMIVRDQSEIASWDRDATVEADAGLRGGVGGWAGRRRCGRTVEVDGHGAHLLGVDDDRELLPVLGAHREVLRVRARVRVGLRRVADLQVGLELDRDGVVARLVVRADLDQVDGHVGPLVDLDVHVDRVLLDRRALPLALLLLLVLAPRALLGLRLALRLPVVLLVDERLPLLLLPLLLRAVGGDRPNVEVGELVQLEVLLALVLAVGLRLEVGQAVELDLLRQVDAREHERERVAVLARVVALLLDLVLLVHLEQQLVLGGDLVVAPPQLERLPLALLLHERHQRLRRQLPHLLHLRAVGGRLGLEVLRAERVEVPELDLGLPPLRQRRASRLDGG